MERKRAGLLLGMILLMGLLDMVGVASIMPFMAVLGNPEIVETNAILNRTFIFANGLGISTEKQFLFALGIFFFVFLLLSLAFKALATYAQLHFSMMRQYSIGKRLIEGYLHQPYSWFLNRDSADLGKSILSEVDRVINGGIIPMLSLISHGVVATALIFLLILVDPKLAFIIGLTLASVYSLIYKGTLNMLKRSGEESYEANRMRFTVVSEAFGASKEVKVGGLEQAYIDRFSDPASTFARHQAKAQIIGQLPRFGLEAIVFGGMLIVVMYLMAQSGNFVSVLPVIVLYAFAGYKLMPSLQAIYNSLTQLRFVGHSIDALYQDLMSLQPSSLHQTKAVMSLTHTITLNHIQYCYPNAPLPALKDLSLTIPVRSVVGLVGATGSGKTTTVDLILGLLEAEEGTLEVDGQPINEGNRRSWQRAIGYVPQQIYLADDTVAANIAFGVGAKDIDYASIERAAKIASLHEFIISELPHQYHTTIGERGIRLSGGQRQRIGIARALYHNPQVLILDEATSALDNLTEQAVIEAIHNLGHEITIILIAHRLSTVKACDIIFLLDKGELRAHGTYDELTQTNEKFRAMVGN